MEISTCLFQAGQKLVDKDHFASDDISEEIQGLEEKWNDLMKITQEKAQLLREAHQVQTYMTLLLICKHHHGTFDIIMGLLTSSWDF